ncbi:unnamed protein product [Lota lota]
MTSAARLFPSRLAAVQASILRAMQVYLLSGNTSTCVDTPSPPPASPRRSEPTGFWVLGSQRAMSFAHYRAPPRTNNLVSSSTHAPASARPPPSTTSKIAYFKRKYAQEENLQGRLHGYLQKHMILQEERSCILKLSLDKLRFLDDPEAYLRRSVLINNLLRKIHHQEEVLGEEEQEEEEEEEVVAVARRRGPSGLQSAYPDRKRVKLTVRDRCPSSLGLRELPHRYHLLPTGYPACTCLCRLDACPGVGAERGTRQYLLYKMDDKG